MMCLGLRCGSAMFSIQHPSRCARPILRHTVDEVRVGNELRGHLDVLFGPKGLDGLLGWFIPLERPASQ